MLRGLIMISRGSAMKTRMPHAGAQRLPRPCLAMNLLAAALTAALALVGPGCTTTHHLQPQAAAADNALASVPVTVRTHDGRIIEIEVVESSAEYLTGTDPTGQSHTFRLEDIASLQVTRFSAGKTALLTVGIVVAIASLTAAALASAGPLGIPL